MKKNLFILGPVASGKNSLVEKLKEHNNVNYLDTGQIYRYVSFAILNYTDIKPDIDLISNGDKNEIDRILKKIYSWNRTITQKLEKLNLEETVFNDGDGIIKINELYSSSVNKLVSIIAKSPFIRKKILQYINNFAIKQNNTFSMTGHNINEIDTTKFIVVFLDISNEAAANRLYNRNKNSYSDLNAAYEEVIHRNSVDNIDTTREIVKSIYPHIYVDTTNLNEDEIHKQVVEKVDTIEKKYLSFSTLQSNRGIQYSAFNWIHHPFLETIKKFIIPIIAKQSKDNPFIHKSDLIYQVLISLCAYDINVLFLGSKDDLSLFYIVNSDLVKRNINRFKEADKLIDLGRIKINEDIVRLVINKEVLKLKRGLEDNLFIDNMILLNETKGQQNYITNNKGAEHIVVEIPSNRRILFQRIDSQLSSVIATNCHYLHSYRDDEYVAYGAFYENDVFPIAWVSYSLQDRDYKKQLLHYLNIESHNTIEMTRAWCCDNAPKNIMSYLFQYSINDLSLDWKEKRTNGSRTNLLSAVTTTINPNLGFNAISFTACNFVPFALRPAKFTYLQDNNGYFNYFTRREIIDSGVHQNITENKFNILPLNEMIMCTDSNTKELILSDKICIMDKEIYDSEMEKQKVFKKEKKNI